MGNQFKPGDMALIIGCRSNPINVGKTCELIELLSPGELSNWNDPADGCFIRSGCPEDAWLVIGDALVGRVGLVAPRHLMPLRKDFDPEQQTARGVEPCA